MDGGRGRRDMADEDEDEEEYLPPQVALYEKFVEGRLKRDLQRAMDERGKLEAALQTFERLGRSIRVMEAYGSDMQALDTLVNVGSDVLAQARVPDTRTVFVSVGLGFFVELTRVEAIEFSELRVQQLTGQVENVSRKIVGIKANIKLATEGISKLAEIERETEALEEDDD